MAENNKKTVDITEDKDSKLSKGAKKRKSSVAKNSKSPKLLCVHHNSELVISNENFYVANQQSLYGSIKYIPVCKKCIKKIYGEYYIQSGKDYIRALFLTCRKLDVKFDLSVCETAIKRANGLGENVIGWYFQYYNSINTSPSNFDDSDNVEKQGTIEDFVKKAKEGGKLNSDDKRNLKDIKKKLGFDPFEGYGYTEYDLGKLYQEFVGYLEDDELLGDSYRLNTILQIINNNHQIRTYDLYISILNNNIGNFKENMSLLTTMSDRKNKAIEASVKIYKENKWLSDGGSTSKSKLAGMMKYYRELGFEQAKSNYFNQLVSEACLSVQEISTKSILNQINFGEHDQNEIFRIQRELIDSKDSEIMKLTNEVQALAKEVLSLKTGE